jgi:hypothetical protein
MLDGSTDTGFKGGINDLVGLSIYTNISSTGTLHFGGDGVVGSMAEQAAWVLNGINSMTLQSQVTNIAAYVPTGGLASSTTISPDSPRSLCLLPLSSACSFFSLVSSPPRRHR